jgi:hypothetical protein
MPGYLDLIARPLQPLHFELTLFILNPESDPLTAVWTVELPSGIKESQEHRALTGRTVVPAHRKVEASNWLIVVDSPELCGRQQLKANAEISVPERRFSDWLWATVAQLRTE